MFNARFDITAQHGRHAQEIQSFRDPLPIFQGLKYLQRFMVMAFCLLGTADVNVPIPQTIEAAGYRPRVSNIPGQSQRLVEITARLLIILRCPKFAQIEQCRPLQLAL